ncbi:MAG: hypothetical protein HY293_05430, partial [Planctomycetes bacterium]|nr:hypothetical protein [Planctomycetota bacterium]
MSVPPDELGFRQRHGCPDLELHLLLHLPHGRGEGRPGEDRPELDEQPATHLPDAEGLPRRPGHDPARAGGAPTAKPPAPPPPAADFKPELEALRSEVAGPLAQNNFKFAQAVLDRARGLHSEPAWKQGLEELDRNLRDKVRTRFNELKESATQAAQRKAFDEVRDARAEIARWGPSFQSTLKEFENLFETALAGVAPPPEPVKPPEPKPPDPPPAEPARTEAGKKYLEAWKKAMEAAARRDFGRAISDLRAAGQGVTEEEVRKEQAADLKDLERLQALHPEMLKTMAALRGWEEIAVELIQEDGTRAAVRGTILQAGPRRLELRNEPRFVEIEDIAPSSLARIFANKKGALPPEDAAALALFRALDGDAADASSPKLRALAAAPRAPSDDPARKKEWAAKKLYYDAEKDYRSPDTRGAALEKFNRLLSDYGDTEFVRASRADVAARIEETRDYVFGAGRIAGKGVFSVQKLSVVVGKDKVEMSGWRAREEPAADDPNNYLEVSFFAPAGVEYKAWALVGGCCTTTFTWFLQANELIYVDRKTRKPLACDPGGNYAAPWEHRLKSLSTTHGGKNHAKAEKEPTIWEWLEIPISKYSIAGPKAIRFLGGSKGQAVAAVIVSANRDKRPGLEEIKKIAEMAPDEAVPTSALRVGKGEPDLLAQIPEARNYVLVYDLDLAKIKKGVVYDVDRHAEVKPFDRIAYALELQKSGGPMQYLFVSMDPFTEDAGKIGIPEASTGASFQQMVTAMNIHSNVEGLPTGINLDGGNIEFWPNNYGPYNGKSIPGATNDKYDFGDQMGQPVDGYGCMQVHHYKSGQTI